uniref:Ig-like domain-containing protein n=1 Tax=Leptobrachium leishanense TaxID=445787 RepID=A0A8C5LT10_9ANUR
MEKKMSLIQLLVALTLAAASVLGFTMTTTKGTVYLSETAELMCDFPKPENLEKLSNLAYYWQNDADEVLYELENGKLKTEHIDQKYKNRTMTIQSNLNLLLHNVTPQDRQTYRCFVFNATSWRVKIHECVHKLDVIVNYTSPEIRVISKWSEKFGNTFKLECLSRQYYPDPEGIMWTIHNSSGTFNVEGNSVVRNDTRTQTFSVSSALTIYVDVNTTMRCMIKANQTLKSEPLQIVINAEPLPGDAGYELYIWIALGIVGLLFIFGIIFLSWKLITTQRSPQGSNQQNGHVNDIQLVVNPRSNSDTPAERNSLLNGVEPHA